ncbi:DUF167 family protein [Roseibium aggregatum]|uniref:UPF0235 protein HK439_11535 n=1 Tax=Roseibium aggregatum TaxID=187304 RepID=A0A926NT30_9HYPH|nr:DUF167 family protein [Roseibium aggregatum]MBD1546897.1 DUF167 domain-containing protein [Roseibium aggregatum]
MSTDHPWRRSGDGLLVDVRLTPKSSKDGIDGIEQLADGRCVLKARVRAVPEKGAANTALIKLVAKAVGLPKSAVDLESGSTSRIKILRLSGDADQFAAALASICSE